MQEKTESLNGNQATRFKEGDRVFYNNNGDKDCGVVVAVDGSIYNRLGKIWVKWSSDERVLPANAAYLTLVCNHGIKEQEAVMLLLSLGYTVSKKHLAEDAKVN